MKKIISLSFSFILFPLLIAYVSYLQIQPLFTGEFTQQLSSIEVSYISMARFVLRFWPNLSWQPLWYFGYPFYLLYTPLLPFLEVLGKVLLGFSISHSYRFFTAFAYVFAPVSVYLFVLGVAKSKIGALISALIYSSAPSLLGFIFNSVRGDRFTQLLEPRRFTVLVRWGEGPHLLALAFLPLASLFFYRAVTKNRFLDKILTAIFIGLTFLTNAVAVWALSTLIFALILEILAFPKQEFKKIFLRILSIAAVTLGLICFWYHPAFIFSFFGEGGSNFSYWLMFFPWGIVGLLLSGIFYFQFLKKVLKKIPGISSALTWFILMFGIVYVYYSSGDERIELVPQALRLNTEADMALALVIGCLFAYFWNWLWKKKIIFKVIGFIIALAIILPLLYNSFLLSQALPQYTEPLEKTNATLFSSAEYRVAAYLNQIVKPGERVFAPGNYGFFLNYFNDVWQLRGALYQSAVNKWPDHIYYQITNGENPEVALDWLKIANISYLVYTTGGSREVYKDYKISTEKFDQVLTRTEESEGDIYYQVPLQDNSLVKVVSQNLLGVPVPKNAIDKKTISQYVALLEANPGQAKADFVNNGEIKIKATVKENEIILVQSAYHQGWQARDSLGKLSVGRDSLGFLIIYPRQPGTVQIDLSHHWIFSQYLGLIVTLLTLCFICIYKPIKLLNNRHKSVSG